MESLTQCLELLFFPDGKLDKDLLSLLVQIAALVTVVVVGLAWRSAFLGRRRTETMADLLVACDRLMVGMKNEQDWFSSYVRETFARPKKMEGYVSTFIERYERAKIDFTEKDLAPAYKLYIHQKHWAEVALYSVGPNASSQDRIDQYGIFQERLVTKNWNEESLAIRKYIEADLGPIAKGKKRSWLRSIRAKRAWEKRQPKNKSSS